MNRLYFPNALSINKAEDQLGIIKAWNYVTIPINKHNYVYI